MKRYFRKEKWLGVLAVSLALAMVATGAIWASNNGTVATAESTTQTGSILDAMGVTSTLTGVESPFQQVYKQVSPSVVGVNVRVPATFYGGRLYSEEQSRLSGSGVIIGVEGDARYILTNNHVVENSTAFSITANDSEYEATLVARDEDTDLAVLKVTDPEMNLPAVPLGDSDAVEVGEWVMVIGTPLSESFANTLTVGVVSGLDRKVTTRSSSGRNSYTNTMIQVDAAINSGNSGGALFNTKGELIGIPSMKMSGTTSFFGGASIEGIGMAIPINTAKQVVPDLITYKQVMRPRLGVSVSTLESNSDVPTETSLPYGVLIRMVESNSPAEAAGLKAYDILLKADGERLRTTNDLTTAIQSHQVGETIELEVYRVPNLSTLKPDDKLPEGETLTIQVEIKIIDNAQATKG